MQNVGILTYFSLPNFGAQLQATSTVGYLKKKGYNPILINWYPKDLQDMYRRRVPEIQIEYHLSYAKLLPVSRKCDTIDDVEDVIKELNIHILIIGSDALFKYVPLNCRRYFDFRSFRFRKREIYSDQEYSNNPFWGDFSDEFINDCKILICSVSCQNSPFYKLGKKEKKDLHTLVNKFDYISVRDEWTKAMLYYIDAGKKVYLSPDPVFSFNQNMYFELPSKEDIMAKYCLPSNYVLLSFRLNILPKEYILQICENLKHNGLIPVAFPMPEGLKDYGIENRIDLPLPILDWYSLIKYSKGYIGERMHPVICAIHNNVPFFSFDEYGVVKTLIPKFWKIHKWNSSKLFHIITRAGLDSNICSYYSGHIPSAKDVCSSLLNMDLNLLSEFAAQMRSEYEDNMDRMFNVV